MWVHDGLTAHVLPRSWMAWGLTREVIHALTGIFWLNPPVPEENFLRKNDPPNFGQVKSRVFFGMFTLWYTTIAIENGDL